MRCADEYVVDVADGAAEKRPWLALRSEVTEVLDDPVANAVWVAEEEVD